MCLLLILLSIRETDQFLIKHRTVARSIGTLNRWFDSTSCFFFFFWNRKSRINCWRCYCLRFITSAYPIHTCSFNDRLQQPDRILCSFSIPRSIRIFFMIDCCRNESTNFCSEREGKKNWNREKWKIKRKIRRERERETLNFEPVCIWFTSFNI